MTEKMTPYDAGRQDEDDVLEAFERARQAAPDDRALLRAWAERFPGHADALEAQFLRPRADPLH